MFGQKPQQTSQMDMQGKLNIAFFIAKTAATSVEVFLHRDLGERYVGIQGLAAVVLLVLFAAAFPKDDQRPLVVFLLSFLVMCGVTRASVIRRRMTGALCHSQYTGVPRIQHLFPGWKEITLKRFVEPVIVAGLGFAISSWNRPLGFYLVFAAGALFISVSVSCALEREQSLDLTDSVIESADAAHDFHSKFDPFND